MSQLQDYGSNPIIVRDLKKIYPGQDGQPHKVGVAVAFACLSSHI